jgi:hypothetical protein
MAQTAEFHLKLILGDLLFNIANLTAQNEALRENQKAPVEEKPTAPGVRVEP